MVIFLAGVGGADDCPNLSYPNIPWETSIEVLKKELPKPFSFKWESMNGGVDASPEYPATIWFNGIIDSIRDILMEGKYKWGFIKSGGGFSDYYISDIKDRWKSRPDCWGDQLGMTIVYDKETRMPVIISKRFFWQNASLGKGGRNQVFETASTAISNKSGLEPKKYTGSIRATTDKIGKAEIAIWNGKTMRAYLIVYTTHAMDWPRGLFIVVNKANWAKLKNKIQSASNDKKQKDAKSMEKQF